MKNIRLIFLFSLLFAFQSCTSGSDNLNLNNSGSGEVNNGNTDGNTDGNDGNSNNNQSNPVGTNGEITLYSVRGEDISKIVDYQVYGQDLVYQQDLQEHQKLWRLVKKIVPLSYRDKIGEFLIYNGSVTETNGLSVQINNDLSKWKLGIAINYSNDDQQQLIYTIVHEFGHILTLNNDQINTTIREDSCTTFYTNLGCSKSDSYLNQFQNQFWADIWDAFLTAQGDGVMGIQSFYTTYSDRFLVQNSANNPKEDIADAFAIFVTREEGSTGNSIAEQKIEFMYNFSELVSLRNYIRTNLGSSSGG
jgi:hypothetical protein